MQAPPKVLTLCDQYLEQIRHNSQHNFDKQDRFILLRAFGEFKIEKVWDEEKQIKRLVMSRASQVLAQLAILTARHVLPIWDQFETEKRSNSSSVKAPQHMIEMAQSLLDTLIDADKAYEDLCGDFYFTDAAIQNDTYRNVYGAFATTYNSLETALVGMGGFNNDFGLYRMIAYATIDETEPGLWVWDQYKKDEDETSVKDQFYGRQDVTKFDEKTLQHLKKLDSFEKEKYARLEKYKPIVVDSQKALEYWEWWLTEAIPQAWAK